MDIKSYWVKWKNNNRVKKNRGRQGGKEREGREGRRGRKERKRGREKGVSLLQVGERKKELEKEKVIFQCVY